MIYNSFTVEVDADGIALLTIDLPDQTLNVWNDSLIAEFSQFVDVFLADDAMKGLVITSGKPNSFIAGADLRMLQAQSVRMTQEGFDEAFKVSALFRRLETGGHSTKAISKEGKMAKPVACAVEGLALGGGLELVLACHYRVVANDPSIQLGLPEVSIGLLPGAGGTQRALRLIGIQNATVMAMQGNPINPETAYAQGLVDELVERGSTVAGAKAWVKANPMALAPWDKKGFKVPGGAGMLNPEIAQFFVATNATALAQTRNNYPAIQAILSCIFEGSVLPMDKALAIEVKHFMSLRADPVSGNMIRSLFVNKQALNKESARPKEVPRIDIKNVGVLGAGKTGAGIAYVTAKAGMNVVVLDRTEADAQKAVTYARNILDQAVAKGRTTSDAADAFLARIKATTDYNDLADVDLMIEAMFERPDVKADVIQATQAVIRENVVFASSTSTISIGELAKSFKRPELSLGMHFISPVERMSLLEIMPHSGTSDYAISAVFDFNRKVRKIPIVVSDVGGFYTNQVYFSYLNEGINLVVEGVSPALIENSARNLGMPIGPLAQLDEVTLNVSLDLLNRVKLETGDKYRSVKVDAFYDLMLNTLSRRGREFGAGLYDYAVDGKRLGLWTGLSAHYPLAERQPDPREVKNRILFAQLVPAARCYTEGVVRDPQSADVGAIFGCGFPSWTGGPLAHIDTLGLSEFVTACKRLEADHGERFKIPAILELWSSEGRKIYA